MKRKYLYILIGLIVVMIVYFSWKEYHRQNEDLIESNPHYQLNAPEFINAFEKDSAAAGKKYIDKVVVVSGIVKAVDTSGIISLGNQDEMSSVQCSMDKRHSINYNNIQIGNVVKIKGLCNGYESQELLGTDVKLNFCVFDN